MCALTLSVTYASLFIFCTGLISTISAITNGKVLKSSNKYLWRLTMASFAFMVIETVFLSTIPEEGLQVFPHRFLLRYSHMLIPLVLLLAIKICANTGALLGKRTWILILAVLSVCVCYFGVMQGRTTQGIVDGFVFLVMENLSKYFMRYSDVVLVIAAGAVVLALIWMENKKKRDIRRIVLGGGIALIVALWVINYIQLPLYNNVITGGRVIQKDSIRIANYFNEQDIDFVYYIEPENGERYPRNFYGYIKQEWQVINQFQIGEIVRNEEKAVFLTLKDENIEVEKLSEIDLSTEKLKVYVSQK